MAVFLLVFMVAVIMLIEYLRYLRNRPEARDTGEQASSRSVDHVEGLAMPSGLAFHPMHTWARAEDAQVAVVGIDDFARRLVGEIDHVVLPVTNVEVENGQGCTLLRSGERVAPVGSPLEGEIVAVNHELLENPELISTDPYGKGWLYKIRSWRLAEQLGNLLGGGVARNWMELSAQRLRSSLGGPLGEVAQDGGELLEYFGKDLPCTEWVKLVRDHLGTEALECK